MLDSLLIQATVASIIACFACGLGALPLMLRGIDFRNHVPLGYAFAGGLMISASVFNLIGPAVRDNTPRVVALLLFGIATGCYFLHLTERFLSHERFENSRFLGVGSKRTLLILIAMSFHSIPEGVAVGVGYGSGVEGFGTYIAIAIAIHNIPEGLAIAIPHRAEGGSIHRAFWLAVLSSAPQPVAAIPAALAVWFFKPLLIPSLGFAAGAMMYLVLLELLPDALKGASAQRVAAMFMVGFGLMLLVQAAI